MDGANLRGYLQLELDIAPAPVAFHKNLRSVFDLIQGQEAQLNAILHRPSRRLRKPSRRHGEFETVSNG